MADSDIEQPVVRVVVIAGNKIIVENEFSAFPVLFGRNPNCQVALNFPFVSRSHCMLVEEDEGIFVIDLQSSLGFTVDDIKVSRAKINQEITFNIGSLSIRVVARDKNVEHDTNVIDDVTGPVTPLLHRPVKEPPPKKVVPPLPTVPGMLPTQPQATPMAPLKSIRDHDEDSKSGAIKSGTQAGIYPPNSPHKKSPPPAPTGAFNVSPKTPNRASGRTPVSPVDEFLPLDVDGSIAPTPFFGESGINSGALHFAHDLQRVPIIETDQRPTMTTLHESAATAKYRCVEAVLSWHDVIYEVKEFFVNQSISVGPRGLASIVVPTIKTTITVAKVGKDLTKCFALGEHKIAFSRAGSNMHPQQMTLANILKQNDRGQLWSMNPTDVSTIDLGSGLTLNLRYVPATKPLSNAKVIETDDSLRESLLGSLIMHVALVMIIFLTSPAQKAVPKFKNVPERYARLLVEKPKPKPTPAPTPKPEIARKIEPPKVEKKVVMKKPPKPMKLPKVLAKLNKYPMDVKTPVAKAPPPVKVEALGALGALGAISKTAPSNVVTNININKDAGGLPTKTLDTGGIAGALPSTNGKLAAAGGRVTTKGLGVGSGSGYGIAGLKGTAGSRGIAGAIVGEPKLASIAKVEGLTRAQVMTIVKKYMGEIQHCYEKNLLSNPDLAGRIDFEWDISPGGKVTDVRVKRSTVNNGDKLVDCARTVFFSMPFPSAKNGMITTPTIGFPFGRL